MGSRCQEKLYRIWNYDPLQNILTVGDSIRITAASLLFSFLSMGWFLLDGIPRCRFCIGSRAHRNVSLEWLVDAEVSCLNLNSPCIVFSIKLTASRPLKYRFRISPTDRITRINRRPMKLICRRCRLCKSKMGVSCFTCTETRKWGMRVLSSAVFLTNTETWAGRYPGWRLMFVNWAAFISSGYIFPCDFSLSWCWKIK